MEIMLDDFTENLERIRKQYDGQKREIEELRKKIREYNKDDEIVKRDQKIRSLYDHSLLQMSDTEVLRNKEFIGRHFRACCEGGKKSRGNTWIYTLTGTGIGTCIEIKCPICGKSEDITDTDNW